MKYSPISIVDGFYADETRPYSHQDVVNLIPAQAEQEGTRTPSKLTTAPGLRPYVAIAEGVVRNVHVCNGRLFAVVGTTLYRVQTTGSVALGTIPGVTRVQSAHNQITNGNEVLFTNGSAGYIYNTVTDTLTKITDDGFVGGFSPVFLDGYFLVVDPSRRFVQMSELADGMNWNTLDRFTSEVDPDPIVAIVESNNELLVLSEISGEFFENTGAAQQPFRSKRIVMEKGCAGRFTVAKMDNTVFWLGDDGTFYQLDGYNPRRISTRPIEQAIRGLNWAQAFAFVWEDAGHTVCYWTFPDGLTWGYDVSTQKWHRRKSYDLNRWRANNAIQFGQVWIVGDFQQGLLWELDWDYILEGDVEIERERTCPVLHDNQNRVLMPRLEVILGGPGAAETIPPEPLFPNVPPSLLGLTGTLPDWVNVTPYTGALTFSGNIGPVSLVGFPVGLPAGATVVVDNVGGTVDIEWPADLSWTTGPLCFSVQITDLAGRLATWSGCINVTSLSWRVTQTMTHALSTTVWAEFGGQRMIFAAGNMVGGVTTIYKSVDDGETFSVVPAVPGAFAVGTGAFGNGVVVMRQNFTGLVYSTDGINWTLTSAAGTDSYYCMIFDGAQFMTLGAGGYALRSTNGIAWTNDADAALSGKTFRTAALIPNPVPGQNGRIVAFSTDRIAYTDNAGVSWTVASYTEPNPSADFVGGTYDAATGIVYAYKSEGLDWRKYESADGGVTWTNALISWPNIGLLPRPAAVTLMFGARQWMGFASSTDVGAGTMFYSDNGLPPYTAETIADWPGALVNPRSVIDGSTGFPLASVKPGVGICLIATDSGGPCAIVMGK